MFKKLSLLSFISLLIFGIVIKNINAVGIHSTPQEFCYSNPKCGPKSPSWTGTCKTGNIQSPIDLDVPFYQENKYSFKSVFNILPLRHLRTDHFFIQNNGHTVNLEFSPQGESKPCKSRGHFNFLFRCSENQYRYKFANAHFHWGKNNKVGSEHTVDGRSFSMEMHLVHYSSKYRSMHEAVESGDHHALVVVAIFFQASPSSKPNQALAPIIRNLQSIRESIPDWERIDEPLDLTNLIPHDNNRVFNYKGSLTTPGCNEQVQWFIFEKPQRISVSDVKAFRQIRDHKGELVLENHRPIQPQNARLIELLV